MSGTKDFSRKLRAADMRLVKSYVGLVKLHHGSIDNPPSVSTLVASIGTVAISATFQHWLVGNALTYIVDELEKQGWSLPDIKEVAAKIEAAEPKPGGFA